MLLPSVSVSIDIMPSTVNIMISEDKLNCPFGALCSGESNLLLTAGFAGNNLAESNCTLTVEQALLLLLSIGQ